MKTGNLLIADDNPNVRDALVLFLKFEFAYIEAVSNPNLLIHKLESGSWDLILLDMNFSPGQSNGNEGIFWLRELRKRFPKVEVVVMTAYAEVELAVRALKEGAADFVVKPWENNKLLATLKNILKVSRIRHELDTTGQGAGNRKEKISAFPELITTGKGLMRDILNLIGKIAPTDANVLITGENGTGKEVVARTIHLQSGRVAEPFVHLDVASLPESLVEGELFGYRKGAFTGATEDYSGKFMMARGGTLFLDEVGNIPLNIQAKLLSVLQTRQVFPLGGNRPYDVNIRLISATNSNPEEMTAQGLMRQDLMYRINTMHLHLPPLRERKEDIPLLADHFLKHYSRHYQKETPDLTREALQQLMVCQWPGNIRELQHVMERAVILSEAKEIPPSVLLSSSRTPSLPDTDDTLEGMEKKMIEAALRKSEGNLSLTAQRLGITRQTLYNKLRKYGL